MARLEVISLATGKVVDWCLGPVGRCPQVMTERECIGFRLLADDPSRDHRLLIGSILLDVDLGADTGRRDSCGCLRFDDPYWIWHLTKPPFESANGETVLAIQSRAPSAGPSGAWRTDLEYTLTVVPDKVSAEDYRRMERDLQALSHSLLLDLNGKSRHAQGRVQSGQAQELDSADQTLAGIERILDRLEPVLAQIAGQAVAQVEQRIGETAYWGSRPLSASAQRHLARSGNDPARLPRPVRLPERCGAATHDVTEHRTLKAFIGLLCTHAAACGRAVRRHQQTLDSAAAARNVSPQRAARIRDREDRGERARLGAAAERALRAQARTEALLRLPFLDGVVASAGVPTHGAFQRGAAYQRVFALMRDYLMAAGQFHDCRGDTAVRKLTSRLFEQWSFLHIVNAFRPHLREMNGWSASLASDVRSLYVIDFRRGLTFDGVTSKGLRVRIRYEPWVYHTSTMPPGEGLFQEHCTASLSPDTVVECLDRHGRTVYCVVVDYKYRQDIRWSWDEVRKYEKIRSSHTGDVVARQLWLVHPGANDSICCEDAFVRFDGNGASCPPNEQPRFELTVRVGGTNGAFDAFARGTIAYLDRHFAPGART